MTESFRAWKVGLPYYLPFIVVGLAVIAVGWGTPWAVVGIVPLGLGLFALNFFRDPTRPISPEGEAIVSPADGLVVEVDELESSPYYPGPCKRIAIFLNVFNVHVNRVPFDGKVTDIQYKTGKFKNAMNPESGQVNESNAIYFETAHGPVTVRQISGAVARRIICIAKPGEDLPKGARFGMIKFGSRTELYLPASAEVRVKLREKVKGGASIVARFPRSD